MSKYFHLMAMMCSINSIDGSLYLYVFFWTNLTEIFRHWSYSLNFLLLRYWCVKLVSFMLSLITVSSLDVILVSFYNFFLKLVIFNCVKLEKLKNLIWMEDLKISSKLLIWKQCKPIAIIIIILWNTVVRSNVTDSSKPKQK